MKRITVSLLKQHRACPEQVELFASLWPDGVTPTKKDCLRAVKKGLDVNWFVSHCLPAPAQAEYYKVRAPALWAALQVV